MRDYLPSSKVFLNKPYWKVLPNKMLRTIFVLIFLTTWMAFFSARAFADWLPDSPGPKLPFAVHWDIASKGAEISQAIDIKEHRFYKFSLAFRYADRRRGTDSFEKLRKYVGDGSFHRVTKESAETNNPVVVPEFTEEEKEFMHHGGALVGGAYFKNHPLKPNERFHEAPPNTVIELTPAGKGTTIPIHIRVERVDSQNEGLLVIDKTAQTNGFYAAGQNGLEREIVCIPLNHGRYRVTAFVEEDVNLPEGVETIFIGTWDPRDAALPMKKAGSFDNPKLSDASTNSSQSTQRFQDTDQRLQNGISSRQPPLLKDELLINSPILTELSGNQATGKLCAIDSVERGDGGLKITFNENVNGRLYINDSSSSYTVLKGQVFNQEMQLIELILKGGVSASLNLGDVHRGCTFTAQENSDLSGIETVGWFQISGDGIRSKEFTTVATRKSP